jgi:hypothetical protein
LGAYDVWILWILWIQSLEADLHEHLTALEAE